MASGATSIWGRPYPLSTDAPAVHTDIQALANSLEAVPTYPTTAVTSRTGVSGESVLVSPSQTLTLPASPVKGDRIQILALGTVTGATPVTVAGGGKVINGVGLSAASSFLLGTPNANATVQYDGTAWRVIDGQQDSGWVALGLTTNTAVDGTAPAYRVVGDRAFLRGGAITNGSYANTSPLATFPTAARPAATVNAAGVVCETPTATNNGTGWLLLNHDGSNTVFTVQNNATPASSQFFFDNVSYPLT